MVEWNELLGGQQRDLRALMRKEGATGRYARIEIDLGAASSDGLLELSGDYIGVVSITGDGTCKVRLDHRHAQQINLREVVEISSPFGKIYFESDGAGGTLTLYIGGALTARLKPIQSKVSLRSVAGTDIDPVQDKRFKSGTWKHKKLTTQTAAGTAERLMVASTPVRWAIIHFVTVAMVGDADVEIIGDADEGQKYAADSYLTVEFCDLYDIYIIDQAGVAVEYSINYIEEA